MSKHLEVHARTDASGAYDRFLPVGDVVEALCSIVDPVTESRRDAGRKHDLPSRDVLIDVVESLRSVLFPGYYSISDLRAENLHYYIGSTLDRVAHTLQEQIKRGLCVTCDNPGDETSCDVAAQQITRTFLDRLPEVRRVLGTDVYAAYCGDPAAKGYAEIIFAYPGLRAITDHRIAHELYRLDVPLIPRIISEHSHAMTGIDIHPGAQIGEEFFIDHGTGVVIGETTIIGKGVRIYQGVTLGAKSFPADENGNPIKGVARHPIVEDGVIIYSGATILGRNIIGAGSVIGGNVWLTKAVAAGTFVSQGQARNLKFEHGGGI